MYAKIVDNHVVFPPKNDGNRMNVDIDINWLTEHGYTDMTQEQIAQYTPKPTVFTKLQIRRAMRTLDIQSKLDTLINMSPVFKSDWTDALQIDLSDPVLVDALKQGGVTEEQIEAIIDQILNERMHTEEIQPVIS